MRTAKRIVTAAMLLSLLAVNQVNAGDDNVVNPDKRVVDKKACEDSGGTFREVEDGSTVCLHQDNSFTACKDRKCDKCEGGSGSGSGCESVRMRFSSGFTTGPAVLAPTIPPTRPPGGPTLPTDPPPQMPTKPLVAPAAGSSQSTIGIRVPPPVNQKSQTRNRAKAAGFKTPLDPEGAKILSDCMLTGGEVTDTPTGGTQCCTFIMCVVCQPAKKCTTNKTQPGIKDTFQNSGAASGAMAPTRPPGGPTLPTEPSPRMPTKPLVVSPIDEYTPIGSKESPSRMKGSK